MIGVGIIGAGGRGVYTLGARMVDIAPDTVLRVVAVSDLLPERCRDAVVYLGGEYRAKGLRPEIAEYRDHRLLIADPRVDLVLITTHTDNHLTPCVDALRSGKKTYLDKPISVTETDALRILRAEKETENPLIMGFTRRYEASWRCAHHLLREGMIGKLRMVQLRSLIPYVRYYQLWHRRTAWSGGALNDKCAHHFDVINWMVGEGCQKLSALGGRSGIFPPDPNGPRFCAECERDCPYRRYPSGEEHPDGAVTLHHPSWQTALNERDRADNCVYLPGADIIDHAFCSMQFGGGVVASLFWAIFAANAPDQETLELLGENGKIHLTRTTGMVELYHDANRKFERFDCRDEEFGSSHFGADLELIRSLEKFCRGGTPIATSWDGYRSLLMVNATARSIDEEGEWQQLGREQ